VHGLVNRSIQTFLRDTYGSDLWHRVATASGAPAHGFEAMLMYPDDMTDAVLSCAAQELRKPVDILLEDFGTHLTSVEALRRLLRFSGAEYADFIEAIEELPGRAQLAVPEIDLPVLDLQSDAPGCYNLTACGPRSAFAPVLAGVLRGMADDYGSLALIDGPVRAGDQATIRIELLETRFAAGRDFQLAMPQA
jgi:Haem-NO-binding